MAARSGAKERWIKVRPSTSRFRKHQVRQKGRGTLHDDPNDVELPLTALADYNLANEVVVTRDGQQALDYLYCRGEFSARATDNPAVMLLDLKLPKIGGLEVLQQVKADERLRMIPVVVLTSPSEEKDMMRSDTL